MCQRYVLMQISDNPELFQPVGEEFIMQANSGQFINDQLWGQSVRFALLHLSWCQVVTDVVHAVTPTMHGWTCLPAALTRQTRASSLRQAPTVVQSWST